MTAPARRRAAHPDDPIRPPSGHGGPHDPRQRRTAADPSRVRDRRPRPAHHRRGGPVRDPARHRRPGRRCSSGCSWRSSPAATSCSRASPASPRRSRSRPSPTPSTRPSAASSSRRTSSRPTSSAPASTAPTRGTFDTELGPVFCNFLLADEINRAPAKVQSALLEVMQERQVTIGRETLRRPDAVPRDGDPEPDRVRGHLPAARGPGRPVHDEGRRRLPDRRRGGARRRALAPPGRRASARSSTAEGSPRSRPPTREIYVDPAIVALRGRPRRPRPASPSASACADLKPYIAFGASPRGSINLVHAARALAADPRPPVRPPGRRLRARAGRPAPPHRPELHGARRGGHGRHRSSTRILPAVPAPRQIDGGAVGMTLADAGSGRRRGAPHPHAGAARPRPDARGAAARARR